MSIVILILFIHWVGDFIVQTKFQKENKSHDVGALVRHTESYSALWIVPMWFVFYKNGFSFEGAGVAAFIFSFITIITHTGIDYITSKINKELWEEGEHNLFFIFLGLDQLLHYIQLLLTYYIFVKP